MGGRDGMGKGWGEWRKEGGKWRKEGAKQGPTCANAGCGGGRCNGSRAWPCLAGHRRPSVALLPRLGLLALYPPGCQEPARGTACKQATFFTIHGPDR